MSVHSLSEYGTRGVHTMNLNCVYPIREFDIWECGRNLQRPNGLSSLRDACLRRIGHSGRFK